MFLSINSQHAEIARNFGREAFHNGVKDQRHMDAEFTLWKNRHYSNCLPTEKIAIGLKWHVGYMEARKAFECERAQQR